MESLLRINEVADKFKISKRTLQYYEEIGLIESTRYGTLSYEFYNHNTINKIEQILILRSLNFSLNDIKEILQSTDNQIPITLLMDRCRTIQSKIGTLISTRQVIKAIIKQYEKGVPDALDIYQLLKDQVYINKKIEGMLDINDYIDDMLEVQFGIDIVPYAQNIIDNINSIRIELEAKYKKELPLIRIRAVNILYKLEYRLLIKGIAATSRNFDNNSRDEIISIIKTDLKTLIEYNIDNLIKL